MADFDEAFANGEHDLGIVDYFGRFGCGGLSEPSRASELRHIENLFDFTNQRFLEIMSGKMWPLDDRSVCLEPH